MILVDFQKMSFSLLQTVVVWSWITNDMHWPRGECFAPPPSPRGSAPSFGKVLSGLQRFTGRWFHICHSFFFNSTIYVDPEAFLVGTLMWFWEHAEIFMKSIKWNRGNSFIVFSIHFHGYKRLQNLILIIFRHYDFPELVFMMFLMICVFNGHSDNYK